MRRALGCGALLLAITAPPAAAQWTQGGIGRVWVKTAVFTQQTGTRFNFEGRRDTTWGLTNGQADSRAVFTDIIIGLHPKLDLWIQIPYLNLSFTSPAESLNSSGFGDVRGWIRWQVTTLNGGRTPISIRVGAKAPLGFSPLEAQRIPLGEGQWDLELFGEVGHSFWPVPAYAGIWLGYRARFADSQKLWDPGGKYVYLVESGVNPTSGTLLKVTLDGFVGRKWIVERIRVQTARKITTLQVGAAVRAREPVWLEGGIRIPLAGQEFPAGNQFVIGLSAALGR